MRLLRKPDIRTSISVVGGGRYHFTDDEAQIRGRGNSTWNFAKKSYKIKLSERENMLGIAEGANKDWVLLANMCDHALLRNYTGLSLYQYFDRVTRQFAVTYVELLTKDAGGKMTMDPCGTSTSPSETATKPVNT